MADHYKSKLYFCFAICSVWTCKSFQPTSIVNSPLRMLKHPSLDLPTNSKHMHRTLFFSLYAAGKKNISASDRERRDEEQRRSERKEDVVIGKTSAKKGASDYALDPKATEQEYLRQLSRQEQEIFHLTEQGMELLNSLKLEESNRAFDEVFKIRPNTYLWQAGIVKFYLGEIEDAAAIFARNAKTYESKFGSQASEERIWRDACELKFLNNLSRSKRKEMEKSGDISTLIQSIPEFKSQDIFSMETRKVIKLTKELFGSSLDSDMSSEILARAKLRSLCGAEDKYSTPDRKMWKLNAWFYQGLYLDTLGDSTESKKCMKMALKLCPSSGKSDDIIHTLPLLHMSVRDWFDDDEFEQDPMTKESSSGDDVKFSPPKPKLSDNSYAYADPYIEESIREGVGKMRLGELKNALRLRGLNVAGSKNTLQERLFYSLMDDAGFQSGFAP